MSAMKLPWAELRDGWSDDDTWQEFGEVVRDASSRLNRYEQTGYARDFWHDVVEFGWHSVLLREEFGGLEFDGRALAEITAPLAISGCSHAFLGTALDAVALLQSVASKNSDTLLTQAGDGLRFQVALAESHDAPYPAGISTRVDRSPSGYRVTGRKFLVPYARAAEGFVVLAASGETGTPALVYVPSDSEGLAVVEQDSIGLPMYDLVFNDVAVDDSFLLAEGASVESALEAMVDLAAALDAVALVAIGSEAIALTLKYTSERVVFDKALDTLQAVQHHCATAFMRVEQAQVLARDALTPRQDSVERAWASSLAKVKAGEGIIEVLRLAHRVHGGVGFYDDYPLAALTRRAVTIQGLHGSVAWHRQRLQGLITNPDNSLERAVLSSKKEGW